MVQRFAASVGAEGRVVVTREEILKLYDVDARGVIRSPGKFEGEMVYLPYFWEKVLEGWQDWEEDDEEGGGLVAGFMVTPEDRALFPELGGKTKLRIVEGDTGFVVELKAD